MCVFGLFFIHTFSLWEFSHIFFYPNQQIKLVEGSLFLGLDAIKLCLIFLSD